MEPDSYMQLLLQQNVCCRGAFGLPSSAAQQQAAQQNRFSGANMAVNMQPVSMYTLHQYTYAQVAQAANCAVK